MSSFSSVSFSSMNDTEYYPMEPGPETVFVPVIWTLIVVVGVTTNALVVYVVVGHMKMTTVTNYYIVNLALTDITFLVVCMPFTMLTYTHHSYMTEGICRVISYVQLASVFATCMTLTIMSGDRFVAIVYPIKSIKYRTRRLAFLLNFGVWIVSYTLAIPSAIFVEVEEQWFYDVEKLYCFEAFNTHKAVYYSYVLICTYVIPLIVITLCYSMLLHAMWTKNDPATFTNIRARKNLKMKKRTTRMLLVVVLLFFICWLPAHIFNCWERYASDGYPYHSDALYYVRILAITLAYSNSCVNPFVYAFLGNNFRSSFRQAFPVCFRRQIGIRNSLMRLHRRGTEEGGTRVTVIAGNIELNNMAPIQQATL